MRRLPNNALSAALYALLSESISVPVTDHVDDEVGLPYVVIGNVTASETKTKNERILRCAVELHIFSEYRGKAEVDSIGESICDLLNSEATTIDMSANNWVVVDGGIENYETYEEDMYGYAGTLTVRVTVQDTEYE